MAMESQKVVSLPGGLRQQFTGLQQRLWRVETLVASCLALAALLFSYLILFVSDRFWETPIGLRVGFTAAGLGAASWFALGWVRKWIVNPRDQRALAMLVQKKYRRLGDRLLGVVELADAERRPAYFSPALYRAAIEQVAAEAAQFDFAGAVSDRPARRSGFVFLGLLATALLPFLLSPPAALNSWHRWIIPAARVPRYTLVTLEGLPKEQIVAHGEAFQLSCQARYRSWWRPTQAVAQFERQPRIGTFEKGGQIQLRIPPQVQRGVLRIRLGDARAEVTIAPTYRPSLKQLSASIALPAYLQYPAAQASAESGSLNVLEGSRVAFQGKVSRPLAAAQLRMGDANPSALSIQAESFSSDALDLDAIPEITFSWRDQLGLESAAAWRLQIHSEKDAPPTPELVDLQKDTALLHSEVLDLKTLVRDDFGVREMGIDWQLLTGDDGSTNRLAQRVRREAPTPREKKLDETFHFSPSLLLIPPDSIVELRAFATDFYPDRQPSETAVYRIHVLGNAQHAELVRQNLESLLSRLEEVTRLEEKVAADTRALQPLSKDKLQAAETSEKLANAKEDQAQNAASLEQMAKEGQKTLREAFRNPAFSEETLRDWAKNLQEMQQLAQENMPQAAKALKSAQQDPDMEARSGNISQALQKEEEILEALEKMQRQANKDLDQLQALTLAQRLRKISSDEKEIAGRLQRIVPETIGMLPKELAPRFKRTEAVLSTEQQAAQKDTEALHGEIGRFFERTQKEAYGQVHKEMTAAHIIDEFERVAGMIQENVTMDSLQNLAAWSDRLKTWADTLEPKSNSSGGGGGGEGGGGAGDESLIKQLMALLRLRDREITLRQRTGLLEKQKAESPAYSASAQALASDQGTVREEMSKVQGENPVPALEFPLQEVVDAMQEVEGLLAKPETGHETEVAQTKAVDRVSDVINLINEEQQRNDSSSSSSASAEEIAFLMQMMAQQNIAAGVTLNPKGGGSQAGGTTDRTANPLLGDPTGKAGESRHVNRAGGTTANLPTEFRDAIEGYFRAVEKLEQKR
jgi:hypothetical protein